MVSENTILYVRFRHAHDMHRSYIPLYTFLTKEMPYFTYFSHTEAVYFRSVKPCRSKYTGLLIAFTASCKGNQCWLYPGGHSHWKVVRGCAAIMTLFSGLSALPKFTINASLIFPPPFKLLENLAFSALFWPEFQLSRRKFSNVGSQDPSFF